MNAFEFTGTLQELLNEDGQDFVSTSTFENAGVLTGDAGLVVRLGDGSEFQITVVQSR